MLRTEGKVTARVEMESHGEIAAIVIISPPLNACSIDVRRGLLNALAKIASDDGVKAAILMGAGSAFVAGSDMQELGTPQEEPQLTAVIVAIENCPKPIVAAIPGEALGCGFELALACDARVTLPTAVVGLPEVALGLMPGVGCAQRVSRLVGVATAIEIVCSGRCISASEAISLGLIDAIVDGDLKAGAIDYAQAMGATARKRRLSAEVVPSDTSEDIEYAEREALRAGFGKEHVTWAIDAVKSAALDPRSEVRASEP